MYRYLLCFLLVFASSVQAAEKRALVIGNGDYPSNSKLKQLSNPANDAEDVANALIKLGFKVTPLIDKDSQDMSNAVQKFKKELQNGDVAWFYFSGHGFSGKDRYNKYTNFLVGSFKETKEKVETKEAFEKQSIDASFIVDSLRSKNPGGINILVLDACRTEIEETKGEDEEGLVSLGKYERFIINYATQPLNSSLGHTNERNSLYTGYLLKGLQDSQLTTKNITEFFNDVGLMIAEKHGSKQIPVVEALPVRFCLMGCGNVQESAKTEVKHKKEQQPEKEQEPEEHKPNIEEEPQQTAKIIKDCDYCPEMVMIPTGNFEMGSNDGKENEKPVHKVTVSSFMMDKYEVTFEEYDYFAEQTSKEKPNDNGWGRGKRPVINVSWDDAVAYAQWLSKETGKTYRLPTEAEWEYAARAGSQSKWYVSEEGQLENYAWYSGNAQGKTHPVGQKQPNKFVLHDMAGNVFEWTCSDKTDSYDGNETKCSNSSNNKVLRGSSWHVPSKYCHATYRLMNFPPSHRKDSIGFRVVRLLH